MSQQVLADDFSGVFGNYLLEGLSVTGGKPVKPLAPVAFTLDFDYLRGLILDFDYLRQLTMNVVYVRVFTLDFSHMSTTAKVSLGRFNIASVDLLKATLLKDGSAWDLSNPAASVTATFLHPEEGTTFNRTLTINSPATAGVVQYQTVITDFLISGWWKMKVYVDDGTGVKKTYPYDITFYMADEARQG